jgi:DNA-binding NarL/FixJ family response regulator
MTTRQRQIAELVTCGYTNAEIALALAVSPNTVKKHLKRLFATLEVANRTELAVRMTLAAAPAPAAT